MSIDAIPAELRERPQWVLWRTEKRDGKPTKVPYQVANPSKRADTTDPNTWGTFEEALRALNADDGGVGYVFAKDDPYVGVDIDGCRDPETGLLSPEAGAVVQGLDSYTEASVSGTGVHSILKAKLPGTRRRTAAMGRGSQPVVRRQAQIRSCSSAASRRAVGGVDDVIGARPSTGLSRPVLRTGSLRW
jgi:putative DNA primase/helicase